MNKVKKQSKQDFSVEIINVNDYNAEVFDKENYLVWLIKYCNDLREEKEMRFLEKNSFFPITQEFVFTFSSSEETTDFYKPKILKFLAMNIIDVVSKFIIIQKNELDCFILETSEKWMEGKNTKVGIKYIFPNTSINRTFNDIIREKILEKLSKSENIFTYLYIMPIFPLTNILQKTKEYYPVYGSHTEGTIYTLTTILKDGVTKCNYDNSYDIAEFELFEKINNMKHMIPEKIQDDYNSVESINYFLPLFFSSLFTDDKTLINNKAIDDMNSEEIDMEDADDEYKLAYLFIEMLSKRRLQDSCCIRNIGKIFYNISKGEDEGYYRWIDVIRKYCNSCDTNVWSESMYEKFSIYNNLTIKTLAFYAREDNFEKYNRWHMNFVRPDIEAAIKNPTDMLIAEAFLKSFWLEFIHLGKKDFLIFKRDIHRLVKSDDCMDEIKRMIGKEFVNKLLVLQKEYITNRINLINCGENEREEGESKYSMNIKIDLLIKKLQMDKGQNSVFNSLKTISADTSKDIESMLNSNPYIFGCKNCVIEVDHTVDYKAIVREGKPEDYITLSAGVKYIEKYHMDHPDIKAYIKYMKQVFVEQEYIDYMFKKESAFLIKRNIQKNFVVWIGPTNGSKSLKQKIYLKLFGNHATVAPPSIYFQSDKTSGMNPAIAQMANKTVVFSSEPEDTEQFKAGVIKLLTGGDDFYARTLFEKKEKGMNACFIPIIVLNCVPNISSYDKATKKRFLFLPFHSTFVEESLAPVDEKEQYEKRIFPIIPDMDDNIEKMAQAMLWLMVKNFDKKSLKLIEPPKYVNEYITNYWKDSDPMVCFIESNLERMLLDGGSPDPAYSIDKKEVYKRYKLWAPSIGIEKVDKLSNIIEKMKDSDKLGSTTRNGDWIGWKWKETDADV